eukprot:351909-Chlamydomonas_euryale.AAC.1
MHACVLQPGHQPTSHACGSCEARGAAEQHGPVQRRDSRLPSRVAYDGAWHARQRLGTNCSCRVSLQARDTQVAKREAFERFMEKYGDIPGAGDCSPGANRRMLRKGRLPGRKPAANCSEPAVERRAVDTDIHTDTKSVPLVGHCNACVGAVKCVERRDLRDRMLTRVATLGTLKLQEYEVGSVSIWPMYAPGVLYQATGEPTYSRLLWEASYIHI